MTARHERPLSDANARAALNARHSFLGEDFSGFELTTVRLAGKFITSCDFSRSDLRSATLDGAWILGCDFSEANLQGASLRGTHLTACRLRGADLRGTDLRGASLQKQNTGDDSGGCDLTAALLAGANMPDLRYDSGTYWPEGFDPALAGALPAEA